MNKTKNKCYCPHPPIKFIKNQNFPSAIHDLLKLGSNSNITPFQGDHPKYQKE